MYRRGLRSRARKRIAREELEHAIHFHDITKMVVTKKEKCYFGHFSKLKKRTTYGLNLM